MPAALPSGQGLVLELGSGAGFCRDHLPGVITSEIIHQVRLLLKLIDHEIADYPVFVTM